MSSFNEYFRNTGCKIMVDRFFTGADAYNPDHKITKLNWEIVQDPLYPASYYIENDLTAAHKVKITYFIGTDPEAKYTEFEVPKEIDGCFIVEGAYRVSTNKLGQDYDIRFRTTGKGDHRINFDYDRSYFIDKGVLKIKKINTDLGVDDFSGDIALDDIDKIVGDKREILRLTEAQIKKLQVKLDLSYRPEYITKQLILDCVNFGDDRDRDLIVDKTIDSVPQSFMKYLFKDNKGKNFFQARYRIRTYFSKYDKLFEQTNAITSLCLKFFKGGTDLETGKAIDNDLQVPPGVNAVNLESLKTKIQVQPTVSINPTQLDIIDVADTPINNSTNILNSLTISTHVTDEGIMFDVYTKDFKKVTVPYIDYLNSKVVASEFVDYKTNTLKPDANNEVEVKYRMKRKKVNVLDIDLIDLHPDYRLSETSRQIPFINYTDSVRISMGTSMMKQTIPVINAQRPLVSSGNKEELKDNVLNEKFQYPEGKVVAIDGDDVTIEVPDGKKKKQIKIARRSAIQSLNDVSVFTEPKVKVGQKIKKGDVVCGPLEIGDDTVKLGINTLVLFHAYEGLVHEDALVLSESYAERIASYSVIDLTMDIKTSSALKWIAPIGTHVKSKDSVVTTYKGIRLNEINRMIDEKLGSLIKDEEGHDISEYTIENSLIVPNNIDDAIVSDVIVQENTRIVIPKNVKKPDYSFSRTSKTVINEYEKNKDRSVIYAKYPEYIASDVLDPISMDQKTYKTVYTVRVRLIKYAKAVVGEKITSRYGGKGVVAAIYPDEKMPLVSYPDGTKRRVEVVMNPYSTINRKILGVVLEMALGNCAYRIRDLVEEYKKTAAGRKKIMPLVNKYYENRYVDVDVDDFIKMHDTKPIEDVYYFEVGSFSSFTPQQCQEWMEELGVSTQYDILLPETDMTDIKAMKEVLSQEEYDKEIKKMIGKFKKIDKPLMAGYITLERLYHQPQYSNKVTTSMTDIRKEDPISGRGRYRKEGQSIGEMELTALLARGAKKFITDFREDKNKELNQRFLDNLLGIGLMITDDKGYGQGGSNLKDSMTKLKTKYRLKGGK